MAKITDPKVRVFVGRKLALARENAELKQDEVAIYLFGLEQKNRISEIENGKTLPDAELLLTMCKLYGVSADWVLGFKVEPELDETASIAGLLMSSIGETLFEQVHAATALVAMMCAQHIKSFPKTDVMKLIEASKGVTQQFFLLDKAAQEKLKPFIIDLMECVREFERKQAIQLNGITKELDHAFQRDETDLQQKMILDLANSKNQRFLQTSLNKKEEVKSQADLFAEDI